MHGLILILAVAAQLHNIRDGNAHTINDNTFGFIFTSPQDIFNSRLPWFKTGITVKDAPGSTIERNLITQADEGIAFYQNTTVPVTVSNIIKNRMEHCTWGLVTATKENPALSVAPYQNSSTQTVYVQVNCNSFNFDNYGWIGTGKYPQQGNGTLVTGNTFSSITNWNICVADATQYYYYNSSNMATEDLYGGSNNSFNMDGTAYNTRTQGFLVGTGSNNPCSNKRSSTSNSTDILNLKENENIITFIGFPNPFSTKLEIQARGLITETSYQLIIYDLTGKAIVNQNITLYIDTNFVLETQEWASGVYAMQLLDKDGKTINYQKLIKID